MISKQEMVNKLLMRSQFKIEPALLVHSRQKAGRGRLWWWRSAASRLAAASPYLSVTIIAPVDGANIHCGRSAPWEPPIGRTTLVLYSAPLMHGDLMKRGLGRLQV